jgi:hypothetical protein
MKELRIQLTILIISDPNTADQNPWTSKPEITPEAIMSIRALMTKVKRPRVSMLMGRVKTISIGLKTAFSMPSMAAARRAEEKPLTCIPSIT